MNYAILINPKHYLTYNKNTEIIINSEFNVLNKKYNIKNDFNIKNICGLNYLIFGTEEIEKYNKNISNLSFALGLFEYNNEMLKPIDKNNIDFVNNKQFA